ncbi:hypothetical protein GOP47_0016294 [Adiantum capillus-veneris]|uniref:RING-type E3 ubiquitin transferase n=1 Tax=Adiantum capillus-veneris TaxID=13818 RepID=A0A9D4UI88_ADICA|nr:hypothetical protein GOP47_0016294 [Adiantum capillus-veneris]
MAPMVQNAGKETGNGEHQDRDDDGKDERLTEEETTYQCRICLEKSLKSPVVLACGHLYCWPCLSAWLEGKNATSAVCPTCWHHFCPPGVFDNVMQECQGPKRNIRCLKFVQLDDLHIPNFGCPQCERAEAVQPVILTNCGHVHCWACLAPEVSTVAGDPTATLCCKKRGCHAPNFKPSYQLCPIYGAKNDPNAPPGLPIATRRVAVEEPPPPKRRRTTSDPQPDPGIHEPVFVPRATSLIEWGNFIHFLSELLYDTTHQEVAPSRHS